LSTANFVCIDLGSNPGVLGERPSTNRLSPGTAYELLLLSPTVSAVPASQIAQSV